MLSNRTANFPTDKKGEKINSDNNNFMKLNTIPLTKFDMNFRFKDEKETNETSNFSFKNEFLSKNAYDFIKRKDKYLSSMLLDDSISSKN